MTFTPGGPAVDQGSPSSQGTMAKARQAVPRTQRRREPYPMERSHFRSPTEGPVTGLDVQATCDIDPQAGADCAPGLGVLFEVFGVPSDMCLYELADQALLHAKSHNRLQLGIMLTAIGCIVGWPGEHQHSFKPHAHHHAIRQRDPCAGTKG